MWAYHNVTSCSQSPNLLLILSAVYLSGSLCLVICKTVIYSQWHLCKDGLQLF
jgi:hypothetical protein